MHTLAGRTAAVGRNHRAILILVKFDTEVRQPCNGFRRIADELCKQLTLCRKVTAAECIDKVNCGRVVRFVRRLNTALRHHRVRIPHTELGHDHDGCTGAVCFDCRSSTCTAAADDQHIGIVIGLRQIDTVSGDAAVRLQHIRKLMRNAVAFVRTDLQGFKLILSVVGMECRENGFLLLCRHALRFHCEVLFSCRFHKGKRFLELFGIHIFYSAPFLISRFLLCCKVL